MDPEPRRKPLPRPKGTGKGEFVPQRAWARLTAYRQCSPCALGHGDSGGGHGELSPVPGLQLGPAQLMLHGGGRRCRAGARGGEREGHKQPGGCFPPSWTTATRETCELLGFEWCPQPPKQHRGCWDFTWPVHEGIPEEAEHSLAKTVLAKIRLAQGAPKSSQVHHQAEEVPFLPVQCMEGPPAPMGRPAEVWTRGLLWKRVPAVQ